MRTAGALLFFGLVACSESPNASATAKGSASPTSAGSTTSVVLNTESGRYQVDLDGRIDPKTLPSNAAIKMADGDLAEYSRHLCGLDFANKLRPDRCDVYVQTDPKGLLVGYATILQGQGVRIETELETDRSRGGLGCFVSGELVNTDFENPEAKLDPSKNFQARLGYSAWEKSPGNWMVSPGDDDVDTQGARGMWYIKRSNNKLRISQERWSYCYGSDTYVDEVFNRALTLTRIGN